MGVESLTAKLTGLPSHFFNDGCEFASRHSDKFVALPYDLDANGDASLHVVDAGSCLKKT